MIPLDYHQLKFVNSEYKHTGASWGYGTGKTYAACAKIVKHLLQFNCTCVYFFPIFSQIESTGFPLMMKQLEWAGIRSKPNINKATINTVYGNVRFISYETHPSAIQSFSAGYIVVDEIDSINLDKAINVSDLVLARCREPLVDADGNIHTNKIDYISTPMNGYNFLHYFFVDNADDQHKHITFEHSRRNRHNPPDYVKDLSRQYTPEQKKAFLGGEFVRLDSGIIYHYYNREKHNSKESISKTDALHIGIDFNVGNMSGVVGKMVNNKLHIVEEIVGLQDTFDLINYLKSRYPTNQINAYPDSSGQNRNVASIYTSIDMLERADYFVHALKHNPKVQDRITKLNKAFVEGNLLINVNSCPNLVKALELQPYNKKGEPDKSRGHDHLNDALGYVVYQKEFYVEDDDVGFFTL